MEDADQVKSLRTVTHVVYALQALGFFNGITWLVAVIINYAKKADAVGGWVESHFRWQIRTFWFGLLWAVIGGGAAYVGLFVGGVFGYLSGGNEAAGWGAAGGLVLFAFLGLVIVLVDAIWIIYRIVKGWLRLLDAKPVP